MIPANEMAAYGMSEDEWADRQPAHCRRDAHGRHVGQLWDLYRPELDYLRDRLETGKLPRS